jgi:hypothetical protein
MDCPKGLRVGECCAIRKSGAWFVQSLHACRDAMLSKRGAMGRVEIRKGGQTSMATRNPINIRKTAADMIRQEKANYRRAHPEVTDAEASDRVFERHPDWYLMYVDGIRRRDPPTEIFPEEPIAKAAPSAQEQVYAMIEARVAEIRKARGGAKPDAIDEVFRADPALYETYRRSVGRGARPSADGED